MVHCSPMPHPTLAATNHQSLKHCKQACKMHSNACQCIALPNTALLDCILCMIQAFYQALQIGVSLGTCIWDPIYQINKHAIRRQDLQCKQDLCCTKCSSCVSCPTTRGDNPQKKQNNTCAVSNSPYAANTLQQDRTLSMLKQEVNMSPSTNAWHLPVDDAPTESLCDPVLFASSCYALQISTKHTHLT